MIPLAEIIDTEVIGKIILFSLLTSVGGTAVFSFGIVGIARYDEARRGVRGGSGIGWVILAALCTLIIAAVVVEAIIVMTTK